ncbi:hypothetical protein DL764_005570 [Monosporascus ibericus]|uniref:Uncharacterized protein n=1 Tax=Monosporascus ibericus TaxID=155417 RepID=A0A4Q4TBP1_9PEZI|nr:hypothetical protein DL764_005570 [Monosporascus ibericus]
MRLLRPDTLTATQSELWPPSPSRHPPPLDEDNSTEDESDVPPLLQEEPLTYFLTPATPREEEEDLEFDFDFDAGIEDSSRPRNIVRSVSPSTLDGLKKYKPKSRDPECAILDDDDDDDDSDEEDYIRFRPTKLQPLGFDDLPGRPRSRSATSATNTEEDSLLPVSFHVGSPRGRPARRFAPPRRPFGDKPRGLPPLQRRHSWREPSPDVWSIEEEPEKETMSERGFSVEDLEDGRTGRTKPIDIPAAKPKKRVRFVLPVRE